MSPYEFYACVTGHIGRLSTVTPDDCTVFFHSAELWQSCKPEQGAKLLRFITCLCLYMSGSKSPLEPLRRWTREHNPFSRSKERSSISRPSTPDPCQSALSVHTVQRRASSNPPPHSRSSSVHQAPIICLQDSSTDGVPSSSKSDTVLNGLMTTLGFLKEALTDIPLPGKGAIDVAIHIIVIAQVGV